MKLEQEANPDNTQVTGHGDGWLEINGERHTTSVQLGNDTVAAIEASTLEELCHEDLINVAIQASPEVVIFGSGKEFAPAPIAVVAKFASHGIGAEAMDTLAAARTFNLLVGEGRKVIALLLPPQ